MRTFSPEIKNKISIIISVIAYIIGIILYKCLINKYKLIMSETCIKRTFILYKFPISLLI